MTLVTILILIDGFLQYDKRLIWEVFPECHNPYFNRWFSAIKEIKRYHLLDTGHNPYFNRWFSAITP